MSVCRPYNNNVADRTHTHRPRYVILLFFSASRNLARKKVKTATTMVINRELRSDPDYGHTFYGHYWAIAQPWKNRYITNLAKIVPCSCPLPSWRQPSTHTRRQSVPVYVDPRCHWARDPPGRGTTVQSRATVRYSTTQCSRDGLPWQHGHRLI